MSKTSIIMIPTLLLIVMVISSSGHGQGVMECDENNNCKLVESRATERGGGEEQGSVQEADPDLEPGFPVTTNHWPGTYHAGPVIHTLVGNIDDEPTLEIIVTALAVGPLYAWNSDGTVADGWPAWGVQGIGYPTLGNLSNDYPGLEIFSGHMGNDPSPLVAYNGKGAVLPGWPRESWNYVSTPAALADIDGDGIDEIFIAEESWKLHAYKADGSILEGWPVFTDCGQQLHTPAIADLDGDDDLEIVFSSGRISGSVCLFAYHHDGTSVEGFPVVFEGNADTYPAIGDYDGDGALEIAVATTDEILVYSSTGEIERTLPMEGESFWGSSPALADLTGDGIPEIVHQSETGLDVKLGTGAYYGGWSVDFGEGYHKGNSAPVIGDVDGDQLPEIVFTRYHALANPQGELVILDHYGTRNIKSPKRIVVERGAVPAIADIDLDGRNEIIVTSAFWDGHSGYYSKVWVYDLGGLPHGAIEWGQFMGGPRHQGVYRPSGYRWRMIFPFVVGSNSDEVD